MGKINKDNEYDIVYDYDIEDNTSYEDLKGNIGRGDCLYCGGKLTMEYVGNICFICSKCGKSVHEAIYYRWAAGYEVNLED